jgi:CubicO group peptidase (beta-lactamase class C family)
MAHSHPTRAAARADNLAAGYSLWFGSFWLQADVPAPSTGMPSTTMYSSAEDLGRELTMLLDEGLYGGDRILQPAVSLAMLLAELMSMWLALYFLLRKRRVGLKRWMPLALAVRQNESLITKTTQPNYTASCKRTLSKNPVLLRHQVSFCASLNSK